MRRRQFLHCLPWLPLGVLPWPAAGLRAAPPEFPAVAPRPLRFPRDHGAHPDFRTEWWYLTGWLETDAESLGFQITFFRSRTTHDPANPSRFAPHQLLFAHAALARAAAGKLLHDQRAARVVAGDPAVGFALADTELRLDGWSLRRTAADEYLARIDGQHAQFELCFAPTQPLLLQGEGGYSRKGPQPAQASYYYSRPQLAASGRIALAADVWQPVRGRAWLDHEWSSTVLDPAAAGWDWIGINLADGGALMAFRIRAKAEGASPGGTLWAAARLRGADGRERRFGAQEVSFEPLAVWRSPHTGATYPVRLRLRLGSGSAAASYEIEPLLDDQELDARRSTGAAYWEGAVELRAAGQLRGRGYLELVGYHRPMKL